MPKSIHWSHKNNLPLGVHHFPFVTCISGLSSEINEACLLKMWYDTSIRIHNSVGTHREKSAKMGNISIYIHFHHQTQRRLLTGSMVSLISEVSTSQQRSTSSRCCRPWDGDDLEDFFFLYDQMMKQGNIWKCTRVLMVFFFFNCVCHINYIMMIIAFIIASSFCPYRNGSTGSSISSRLGIIRPEGCSAGERLQ